MTSIVERLRLYAQQFEDQHAPDHITLALRAAADEIERLRRRLEIDPSHPYDGIYCRDETIRGLEKEIERLRAGGCARDQGTTQYCAEAAKKDAEIANLLNTLADERTESMRLRAALERIADTDPDDGTAWFHNVARAALTAQPAAPEERRTGLRLVMVAATLLDQEDLPDEPSAILCGSIDAIRSLGGLLGDSVDVLPAQPAAPGGE